MGLMSPQRRSELLDALLQVAMSCPVDHTNPVDCPLFLIRKIDLTERIQWFNSLSDDELNYLASYHGICLKTKIKLQDAAPCACL